MLPSAPASPSAAHSILEKLHWLYACAVLAPSPLPHALCPHSTDTSNLTIYVCVCRSLPARHVRSLMGGRARHLLGRRMVSVCWARVLQLEPGLPGHATHCDRNVVPYNPPPECAIRCMGGGRKCMRMCEATSSQQHFHSGGCTVVRSHQRATQVCV